MAEESTNEFWRCADQGADRLRRPPARRGPEIHEELFEEKLQQVVAEISFPAGFSFIPWGHHCPIITKCKEVDETLFYLRRMVERGQSRNALDDCILADLYHTAITAITNFGKDYMSFSAEQKGELGALVNQCKTLSAMLKQTIE